MGEEDVEAEKSCVGVAPLPGSAVASLVCTDNLKNEWDLKFSATPKVGLTTDQVGFAVGEGGRRHIGWGCLLGSGVLAVKLLLFQPSIVLLQLVPGSERLEEVGRGCRNERLAVHRGNLSNLGSVPVSSGLGVR